MAYAQSMSQLKEGDKVRIKSDLVVNDEYDGGCIFTEGMAKYRGTVVTVSDPIYFNRRIKIKEDDGIWVWSPSMYEIMPLFKAGDKVRRKSNGDIDTVKEVPGMPEYDKEGYFEADEGFVLENNGWEIQEYWEKVDYLDAHLVVDYSMPKLDCDKPKKHMRISRLAKKILDKDIRTLIKVGWLNSELCVTEEGRIALLSILVMERKADLAKEALRELRERKDEK